MTLTECRTAKANGAPRVTFVGLSGNARYHATIRTVSASGVRVKFEDTGTVERLHPDDLRPGWI